MINGLKKKNALNLIVTICCLVIAVLLIFRLLINNTAKLDQLLMDKFDNKYISESHVVDNLIVSYIRSSFEPPHEGENLFVQSKLVKNASPLLVIQSLKDKKLLNVYEIGVKNNSNTVEKDNLINLSKSYYQTDKFRDFIAATEWNIYYGGSDGLKGQVFFIKNGGKVIPMAGYPKSLSKTSALVVTDKLTGKIYEFPVIPLSYFTMLTDLNKDNKFDLLYGKYLWDYPSEAHYDYHNWILGLYELNNSTFKIPYWWNNGKEYITDQKIDNEGNDQELVKAFNSRIKVSPEPANKIVYLCDNNKKLEVSYLKDKVEVLYEGKQYTLYTAPIASGILYKNEVGDELYSKVNKVVFNKLAACFEL